MQIAHELIQIGLKPRDKQHLFETMVGTLAEQGYVTAEFYRDVAQREAEYPTGLQLEGSPYAFAIPHAHSTHVLKDGICIATLKEPVAFGRLDDPDQTAQATIIFMLAAKDSQLHLELLRDIIGLFGSPDFAQTLLDAKTPNELAAHIEREVEKRRQEED